MFLGKWPISGLERVQQRGHSHHRFDPWHPSYIRNNQCCQEYNKKINFLHYLWEHYLIQTFWKIFWRCLSKLETVTILQFYSLASITRMKKEYFFYSKNTKSPIQTDICTAMLTAAPFIIAKIRKQSKVPQMSG